MGKLCQEYSISDASLKVRRDFIRLTDADVKALKGVAGWARNVAPTIAKEFYDFQFSFGASRVFFEGQAKRLGVAASWRARRPVTTGAFSRKRSAAVISARRTSSPACTSASSTT